MQDESSKPERKRGMTSLTLQWIGEKLRRSEEIKNGLESGSYKVDSESVAKALVSDDPSK